MSADLHIHVLEPPCEERHLRIFFRNTLGSEWGPQSMLEVLLRTPQPDRREEDEAWEAVAKTPNLWIGEVSWLKAALLEDADTFVPGPVAAVDKLVGPGLTDLTPGLGEAIMRAVAQDNTTAYDTLAATEEHKALAAFLVEHRGKRIFTVSW